MTIFFLQVVVLTFGLTLALVNAMVERKNIDLQMLGLWFFLYLGWLK